MAASLLVLSLACADYCAPAVADSPDKLIENGLQLMGKVKHAAAAASFEQATRVCPRNEKAFYFLGTAYYALAADLNLPVDKYKGSAQGEKYMAERDDRYKKALAAFSQAIRLKPDYAQAYLARSEAYGYLQKY